MNIIHTSGKRKTAVARATLKEGKGRVRINGALLETYEPKMSRMKVMEPLQIMENKASKFDISVKVNGGGPASQAEAARLAIGRLFAKMDKKNEEILLNYDRHLLVADVRRKETHKPNRHGKARAKRQKSYR